MGVFFNRYNPNKFGPGVDKNTRRKPVVMEFFVAYTRKFQKLTLLNLLYFVFAIPAIFIAQYLSLNVVHFFGVNSYKDTQNWMALSMLIVCIPLVAVGPVQAGFTYVLRRFSQGDEAFIWQDFRDSARRNLKQSIIICLINVAVFFVLSTSIGWYIAKGEKTLLMSIIIGLQGFILIIFTMMNFYTYPMLVTIELKTIEIYKNAFILTIIKFVPNILMLLLIMALSSVFMFNILIGYILLPFFSLSTIGFIINYFVYPTIKKYLIDGVSTSQSE